MIILVFKTSVQQQGDVQKLRPVLNQITGNNDRWNFDLEDCDNILRIETTSLLSVSISSVLQENGYSCEELD